MVRASFALGHALKQGTQREEKIGILLPTGMGAAIAFLAVSAYGRVPTMLNFTSGNADIKSAIRTAEVKRVVTAHRFIELGKLESVEAAIGEVADLIYLEEVRAKLTLSDKLSGLAGSLIPALMKRTVSSQKPAAILFTSGTEGEPKGVVLSHQNILANIAQARAHFDFYASDVLLNPLPMFHCFGLTVGTLLPLMIGVKIVSHPTPLQPKEIVHRIRHHGATILISTDTFINQYARCSETGELDSLRMAVCGAERLRDETRIFVRKKSSVTLVEGYGVTEASPVVIGAGRSAAARRTPVRHPPLPRCARRASGRARRRRRHRRAAAPGRRRGPRCRARPRAAPRSRGRRHRSAR